MKRILIAMTMFLPMAAWALTGEAVVDGINYYIVTKAKTAEVRAFPYSFEISDIPRYKGDIVIPESIVYEGVECSVTSIGNSAFSNCNELYSVTIPNSVTDIGNSAFAHCNSLTSFTIPNSVTSSIGAFAFSGCKGLNSITIGESVTSIDENAFENCTSLISLTIPNSVITIGNQAFRGCSSLTSIMIGNGVAQIGMEAFENCTSLTSLTIGSGVKKIFYHAFANCPEIADVFCLADEVPATIYSDRYASYVTDTFQDSYIEYATLHVPASCIEAYRAKEPWKSFKNVVAIDNSPTTKCSVPTIAYSDNKLTFTCETKGAECVATISDADIKTHYGNEISLTATYFVSVYATATGYENSDTATATLCWIDADPKTEGIENGVAQVRANAVLIQSHDGVLSIAGIADGTDIAVYSTSGQMVGSAKARGTIATIATSLCSGNVAIVRIGDKSVKVVMQ